MTVEGQYFSPRDMLAMRVAFGALTGAFFVLARQSTQIQRAYRELLEIHQNSHERHVSLHERTMYLIDTLEKKGVNLDELLDEFDFIALKNMEPPT